ncbi:MAG: GGDEF domain-containing protein, partial [Hyphomicrobiales bacterium]
AQQLLDMADVAMYHAKRNGRNSYFWFEDFMADEMRFRARITAGIREGLAKGEFVPFYEQQIDVQSGTVTGFEMLARWNSPQFGLVKPDVFIPIAEEAGLISELSEQLIAKALDDAKEWSPSLSLAVNISPIQLRDPWFSQKLLKLLVEANFPPNRLEIEITESCVHEDIVQVRSLIASLKNQGIRVSLDDFGTGYSSLAQLRMLPFDRIKIDRSFVASLTDNEESAAFIHSIAVLGKGLGLPITAEGIETDAIREHLSSFGEIKGQGYLYGQPTSAEETRSLLSTQGLLQARPGPPQRAMQSDQDDENGTDTPRHIAGN